MDGPSNNDGESQSSSRRQGGSESSSSSQRWTCEACGCNTNSESERSCTICGTSRSNGSAILRRVGYAARASNLFGRGAVAVRRNIINNPNNGGSNEDHSLNFGGMIMDGYYHDFFESVIDGDIDMDGSPSAASGADEESEIDGMAMELANSEGRSAAARLRAAMAMRVDQRSNTDQRELSPDELFRAASENSSIYEPKWMNPSQIGGRTRTGNGIEVGDHPNQNVAYLPMGSGEGRALRALEGFPRSAAFASFSMSSAMASSASSNSFSSISATDRRSRRVFGFKVAFGHPSKGTGENMGGRYLIGVTSTSFSSFGEKGALQQSPFFFGIDDSGNKYEGPRPTNTGSNTLRARRRFSYAVELKEHEAPRNKDGVLFGAREVITCIVDLESRTLTFWRDEDGESKLLGTLVTSIPRGGHLYPIVVPFCVGSTVSITSMSGDPLPSLDSFISEWTQAQLGKEIAVRRQRREARDFFIENGLLKPKVIAILKIIFSLYQTETSLALSRIEAARLWYRCGLRLETLDEILFVSNASKSAEGVRFGDFQALIQRIISDDEDHFPLTDSKEKSDNCSDIQVGEKVELVECYERFGDAANGPLLPGDRGTVIDFQGTQGLRHSVRVIYNGRRWWYQPQALLREKSGLTDSPGIWFMKCILRSHGYNQETLEPLFGQPLSQSSWRIGDFVAPKKVKNSDCADTMSSSKIDEAIGRIAPESSSLGPFPMRVGSSGSVNVEFVSKVFAENTSSPTGSAFKQKQFSVEIRKVPMSRLVHTSPFHGLSVSQKCGKRIPFPRPVICDGDDDDEDSESMDCDDEDYVGDSNDCVLSTFQKLKDLDPLAIERITKECEKSQFSLISLVEAGLLRFILESLDSTMENIKTADDTGDLARAIAALGKLALRIAEKTYPHQCQNNTNDSKSEDGSNNDGYDLVVERSHENTGTTTEGSTLRDSRSSSMLQRRRMLLSLMSHARRAGGGSIEEMISREMRTIPPSVTNADSAAAFLFRNSDNSFGENRSDVENSRSLESTGGETALDCSTQKTILDKFLRGRGQNRPLCDIDRGSVIPLHSVKRIIVMGILGNSLPWLKCLLDLFAKKVPQKRNVSEFPILKNASDEDGTPLLHLAISLGCSVAIIEELIRYGTPITEVEISAAVELNMPDVLSVLFKYHVCSDDVINLKACSPAIASVVSDARKRQVMQNEKLGEEVGAFLISFTQKMLHLSLKRRQRHQESNRDVFGRAIAGVLTGQIDLSTLQSWQQSSSPLRQITAEKSVADSRTALKGMGPRGLLQVLPLAILGRSLSEPFLTNTLLLIEDYLCSKGVNDGCIGLTMLLTLIQKFPRITQSPEVERYGFIELLDSHHALSLNRLGEITSRLMKRKVRNENNIVISGPEVIFCPKQHKAALHVTTHPSFRCDLCGAGVQCGAIMYGCRECDWDACESCTDKVEGGIIKWKYVRELSSQCQGILNRGVLLAKSDTIERSNEWENLMVESLKQNDNISEVNTLSIRLLQRDLDSIHGLREMLKHEGRLTMHQFLMVILPALHSALLGKSLNDEQNTCRRTKKPRVGGIECRDNDGKIGKNEGERLEFAKELLKLLVYDASLHAFDSARSSQETEREHLILNRQQIGASVLKIESLNGKLPTGRKLPELLRRIHQVLSLHEEVQSMNSFVGAKTDDVSPADLRSLKQPIRLRLRNNSIPRSKSDSDTTLLSEPLVSVNELSHQILITASLSHPDYVCFCKRLVEDSAVIMERSQDASAETFWRIAKVVSYNDKVGYHGVQYATACEGEKSLESYINTQMNDGTSWLEFDHKTTNIVLSSKKYFVLRRNQKADSTSAFDMEHLLEQSMVEKGKRNGDSQKVEGVIGLLVESNFKSSSSLPYTIVGVENERCDLLSKNGEVVCGVPIDKINGLNQRINSLDTTLDSSSGEVDSSTQGTESHEQFGNAFPFLLSGRRHNVQAENARPRGSPNKKNRKHVLKRTWSSLALVESMRPADITVTSDEEDHMVPKFNHTKFHCSIGDRQLVVCVEEKFLELSPSFRLRFNSQGHQSPISILPPGDMTLISLLYKLCLGDISDVFREEPHDIFYSIVYQPSTTCKPKNFSLSQKLVEVRNNGTRSSLDSCDTSMGIDVVLNGDQKYSQNLGGNDSECNVVNSANLSENDITSRCEGLDEICVQCLEIIEFLAKADAELGKTHSLVDSIYVNQGLSEKLKRQTEDPLLVVGGIVPDWCLTVPAMTPNIFSYASRKLLINRLAFGVSRSTLRQQDSKVNVGRLRKRMTTLRARAVELVGEAFSGGAADPTALQLQADELYGMEESLASRVRSAFREKGWNEMSLQVVKAAVHRDTLLSDAMSIMDQYSRDLHLNRRRLEVRFDGESGFDAASGDEAGVTRGFYADIAEALMTSETVASVHYTTQCALGLAFQPDQDSMASHHVSQSSKLPLWIPDMDSSGQVVLPTPRANPSSIFGLFPRPLSRLHPQFAEILKYFRFMGRLFAAAMRDGFMFPLPLSSSFLKLVQYSRQKSMPRFNPDLAERPSFHDGKKVGDVLLSEDLPRPGFLGGEVYAVETYICHSLDRIDQEETYLSEGERDRAYSLIATDKNFAREALGKQYDCSFLEYFEDRRFVDPLDPTQGISAYPLCPNGWDRNITIHNIRDWVTAAKHFILYDGVIGQARAFCAGVDDFFSSRFLRFLTSEELQRDVCGMGDNVDRWNEDSIMKLFELENKGSADAWVAVAAIGGNTQALGRRFDPSSTTMKFLVKSLLQASTLQRRQFLSFVTSVPIETPGLIEVIPIVSSTGEFLPMRDPSCLPRANTCARRLYLPKFDSFESFSEVLWAVVKAESKHKGFFEWNL